jgi:hypothetical protein
MMMMVAVATSNVGVVDVSDVEVFVLYGCRP